MTDETGNSSGAGGGRVRNPLLRHGLLLLGWLAVAAAVIGLFLPVMPTVPFLLLAVACFTRTSPRFEAMLLDHPHFGPALRDWRARGAIPRRAKWLALTGSSCGFGLFLWMVTPPWPIALIVGGAIAAAMVYVLSRPDA